MGYLAQWRDYISAIFHICLSFEFEAVWVRILIFFFQIASDCMDLMEQSFLSVAGAGSCIHQGGTSLGSQIWAKQEKLQTNHHETHRYHRWHRSCQFTSNKWNFKETKLCHPKLFSEVTWWQKRRRPVMEPGLTAVTSLGMIRTVERLSLRQFLAADGAYLMTLHWGMIYCKKNHGLWRSKKKSHALF